MAETIAAIATAPGQGGVAIVRLSGSRAEEILLQLFRPASAAALPLTSHLLTYGHVMDGDAPVDECMAVLMRAPRSYTRQDVAQLQLHGGGYIAQAVLALCLRHGARLAEPGEFTRRAFLNGRVDLSRAQAVMALISASGAQAHDAAMRQLQGGAAAFIRQAADKLYALQAGAAACIDYPQEITQEEAVAQLAPGCLQLARELQDACDERSARILQQGFRAVLCGRPNAGKSSLLNALCGEELAIVTDIPGTTRDRVEGSVILDGALIRLTDTAGIRDTADPVEAMGVDRARRAMAQADLVLAVLDGSSPMTDEDRALLASLPQDAVILLSKADLPRAQQELQLPEGRQVLAVSARQPQTLLPLKRLLAQRAAVDDRLALTQPRHLEAVRQAAEALRQAAGSMAHEPVDLAAIHMQQAAQALARITGDQPTERLLDEVFSRFCVGK